jgi:hypothetical protein
MVYEDIAADPTFSNYEDLQQEAIQAMSKDPPSATDYHKRSRALK